MDKGLPNYPQWELIQARKSFAASWERTLTDASAKKTPQKWSSLDVKRLDKLHRSHPVDVFMINCEEYLFPPIDYPPVSLLISPKEKTRKLKRARGTDLEKTEGEEQLKKGRFEEASLPEVIFRCDICDDAGALADVDAANNHLRKTEHSSCSQYELLKFPWYGGGETSSEVLYSPKCIEATTGDEIEYGWKDGDVVTSCPDCRLILPDKFLCVRHFEIQHDASQRVYRISRVLKAGQISVDMCDPVCDKCQTRVADLKSLFLHWFNTSSECCPFPTSFPNDAPQQLELQCGICRRLRDETIYPREGSACQGTVKRFVGHLINHMSDAHKSDAKGLLWFRSVETTGKGRSVLPPLSMTIKLGSSLSETERYTDIVRKFRGQRERYIFIDNAYSELERLKKLLNKSA
ncbi:unnamed protein product [Hymenolepis diminuta]|uniref:C2H2-type domain-containing protein n=1 Tax=Hymenolepis diminuta TaxID=6216 RepID=A0A158QE88_HYMDI|nr:unnamed protein product [Hymenolepis diminuta]